MGFLSNSNFFVRPVPHDLILSILNEYRFDNFIETGSYKGETSFWAEKYFKNVFSFEASEEYFNNLHSTKKIKFIFADSSNDLHNYLSNSAIIYLDAHYSGGNTYKSFPLISELTQINNSKFEDLVLIIDDARFCLSKWNGESYGYLIDILNLVSLGGNRYVCIFDDMIIAVPKKLTGVIDSWVFRRSSAYWNSFRYGNNILKRLKFRIYRLLKFF